ncbi:hypothetical protein AG1IA_00842 [Rhizoctonia solani AG-1 IA]|uniref:Protein kinase domain-containing protein n=1 Tax=Thanatephorus cucumeris (strain AG1-IA) TaxID=983506 RepID=L8X495_THACA|nr:hypothetical protein AG1IA_00842 [Rhizoctonia solani AG-1 IA]
MTATAPCITVSTSSPANTPAASSTNQLGDDGWYAAQLSRNASVISTSSSSSASSLVNTPQTRPRPLRQFSYQPPSRPRSPTDQSSRARSPSRPPVSPSTPRGSRAPPPVWVPRELGRADSDDDSDSVLPALAPPSSRRGSESRIRAQSRKGSVSTVRRCEQPETPIISHSRGPSLSEFAPPASPKSPPGLLAGSPKIIPRALVGPGKRSRVPSTASSAAVLAGQLEVVGGPSQVQTSSSLNPNVPSAVSRTAAPSPTPPPTGRKRRTQSTSTTKARSRSTSAAPRQRQAVSAADFEFGPELGSGSYSTVVKAWLKGNTGANSSSAPGVMGGIAGVAGSGNSDPHLKVYAVKVSDKQYLINKGKVRACQAIQAPKAHPSTLAGQVRQRREIRPCPPRCGKPASRTPRRCQITLDVPRSYQSLLLAVGPLSPHLPRWFLLTSPHYLPCRSFVIACADKPGTSNLVYAKREVFPPIEHCLFLSCE